MHERDKVLEVNQLGVTFGDGCQFCIEATGPTQDSNKCPHCGTIVAVHDVSFDLYRGEILGIMGESGSGKSTVVQCLHFDQQPSQGRAVYCDGEKNWDFFALNAVQQRQMINRQLGIVYQNPQQGLNFDISAGGNIAERLLMSGRLDFTGIRQRAAQLMTQTEVLLQRMDELPKHFSGGMQQRVQIAKALAPNPHLLLLDEVTTGLDLSVQAAILDLILQIQQQRKTSMIVVTHDLGVIRLLADRTLVMKYGRVIEAGLTDQILEDPQHAYTQRLVASAL